MKQVRLHDDARLELTHEALYYAGISAHLGERLVAAVEGAVALAAEFPEIGSPYLLRTRRVFPKKFPFSVVYVVREREIVVLAVAPFSPKPGYWRARRSAA